MNDRGRSLRVGLTAVACALILRFVSGGGLTLLRDFFSQPDIAAFALYLETGRQVRFSPPSGRKLAYPAQSAEPALAPPERPVAETLPCFAGFAPDVRNFTALEPDYPALLEKQLVWDLTEGGPAVLILSTHTTESYTKSGEDYEESAAWRTRDEGFNMLSIGDRVEELLTAAGIGVIRDRDLHDYPSYNGAYGSSRESMAAALEEYPTVRLVLDLHRDASDASGPQLRTQAQVGGEACAQLMLVLGTNHPGYEENLALGLKLMAQLESQAPGITRPTLLRSSRFNQDLHPGALLIEVGAAGNTHREAQLAADQLAQAIIALAKGTQAAPQ